MIVHEVLALAGWFSGLLLMLMSPRPLEDFGQFGNWLRGPMETVNDDKQRTAIIIPARDEAERLPDLFHSLGSVPPSWELIVVDDGSTDGTSDVALAHGAKVVAVAELPDGWLGKSWACWQGALATQADCLIFLDADVLVPARHLQALIPRLGKGRAISVQPWHMVSKFSEQLSVLFNVLVWFGTSRIAHTNRGGFGPCLMVFRSDYFAVHGHKAVSHQVLENSQLASRLAANFVVVENYLGNEGFRFRMYAGGLRTVIAGWSKHFTHGARQTAWSTLLLVALWFAGAGAAFAGWAQSACSALSRRFIAGTWQVSWPQMLELLIMTGLFLAFAVQLYILFRRVGSFHWFTAVLYPLYMLFFLLVFTRAAVNPNRVRVWKGRSI